MLDTARAVPTPEGIELTLRLAGPFARAIAWFIDLGIRAGLLILLSFILLALGRAALGVILIAFFLLEWFYPVLCEVYWGGATPGKKAFDLVVLNDNGTPVTWSTSMIRNLLRAVDFLPFLNGFGFISMLLNREFKRLGDIVAGTVVVYRETKRTHFSLPKEMPLPPPISLSLSEQRAIIGFGERIQQLTPQRAGELAELAQPVVGKAQGDAATKRLLQVANFLIGRK